MNIGIIGGGFVGQTLGAALSATGHEVRLSLREVTPEGLAKPRKNALPLADWQARTGGVVVPMAQAAAWAEVAVLATPGQVAVEVLRPLAAALDGKVLIEMSNALDYSAGMPPFVLPAFYGATSVGEQIQAALPGVRVVKAFNTLNTGVLVDPARVAGEHDVFVAGDDADAKATVTAMAREFGWTRINDLGGIKGARGMETMMTLWGTLVAAAGGSRLVNLHVARGAEH